MNDLCIIKEITNKSRRIDFSDIHIAFIEGKPVPRRRISVNYENILTNERYLCLSGALAWPGKKPGFILIMAVGERKQGHPPVFVGIEEYEDNNISRLLYKAKELDKKYAANCGSIPFVWLGDAKAGYNFLIRKLKGFIKKGTVDFSLTYPPHFEETNPFHVYCRLIMSLAVKGQERIWLTNTPKLNSYIAMIINDEQAQRSKIADFPAVSALGFVLSWLYEYEPWLLPEEEYKTYTSTMPHDYEAFALKEEELAMKEMESDVFDDINEPLGQELVDTIR